MVFCSLKSSVFIFDFWIYFSVMESSIFFDILVDILAVIYLLARYSWT